MGFVLDTGQFPRTAVLSPRLVVVASTGSTNADLAGAVGGGDRADWPHLAVLVTDDQTSGRGRLDRSWTAPAGTALAISVVLRVPSIPPALRGWVPLAAGAAMTRALRVALTGTTDTATLKWPNDVLVNGRKVCGILCETVPGVPDTIIAGAGVNTRMSADELPTSTATSLAVLGAEVDPDAIVAGYLAALDEQLTALATFGDAAASGVLGEVEALCDTLGRDVVVHLPGGGELRGRAQRIDGDGRLVVVSGVREQAVAAGDVVHVR